MNNEKIFSSKSELLQFLGIKENFLYSGFSTKYQSREKPKKNGGIRLIKPPSPKLKKVQRLILDKILIKAEILPCVFGLSKEKSIISNAKAHQSNVNGNLINLDLEDFFPTITQKDVRKIFKQLGFNKENSSILTKICTVDNSLPQGAPSSPVLASLACIELDKRIFLYCKRRGLVYSRYFDDISISGLQITTQQIDAIEKIITTSGFRNNEKKKQFFSPLSEKVINNVVIKKESFSVTEEYKDAIRTSFSILKEEESTHNQRVFAGKIGFYIHVNKAEAMTFKETLK